MYIMASRSKVLYTGVTNDLARRVAQHKTGATIGFTSWYKVTRLVYYEAFTNIRDAIERERRLKGWTRVKKVSLIQKENPRWTDLAREWLSTPPIRPL